MRILSISLVITAMIVLFSCGQESQVSNSTSDSLTNEKKDYASLVQCLASSTALEDPDKCLKSHPELLESLTETQTDSISYYLIEALNRVSNSLDISGDYELDVAKESKKLEPFGIAVNSEEGMPFYCINWNYVFSNMHKKASPNMKAFLRYRDKYPEKLSYDAGLAFSPMELSERTIEAEQLIANGDFLMRDYVLSELSDVTTYIFFGMDNTPSFEYETNELYEESKTALEFLQKNGGPVVAGVVRDFLHHLEVNSWKRTDEMWELYNNEIIRKKLEDKYPLGKQ
ncbi:MAG TPA: hypothetical protein PK637_17630 [Flavobacteriales bacterium]|nr:hypothetical protein [Flavobacteriales bacterium]HRE98589.1 hypothetical protein [Flavobacteriales bacterium]HRJ37150.1 hypothetical protein [Flavobacteriales bacterium]